MYCGLCSVCLFSFFSMGFPRIYLMAGACFHHTNNVMFNMLVFLSHTSKFVRLMDIRNCEKKKTKTKQTQFKTLYFNRWSRTFHCVIFCFFSTSFFAGANKIISWSARFETVRFSDKLLFHILSSYGSIFSLRLHTYTTSYLQFKVQPPNIV